MSIKGVELLVLTCYYEGLMSSRLEKEINVVIPWENALEKIKEGFILTPYPGYPSEFKAYGAFTGDGRNVFADIIFQVPDYDRPINFWQFKERHRSILEGSWTVLDTLPESEYKCLGGSPRRVQLSITNTDAVVKNIRNLLRDQTSVINAITEDSLKKHDMWCESYFHALIDNFSFLAPKLIDILIESRELISGDLAYKIVKHQGVVQQMTCTENDPQFESRTRGSTHCGVQCRNRVSGVRSSYTMVIDSHEKLFKSEKFVVVRSAVAGSYYYNYNYGIHDTIYNATFLPSPTLPDTSKIENTLVTIVMPEYKPEPEPAVERECTSQDWIRSMDVAESKQCNECAKDTEDVFALEWGCPMAVLGGHLMRRVIQELKDKEEVKGVETEESKKAESRKGGKVCAEEKEIPKTIPIEGHSSSSMDTVSELFAKAYHGEATDEDRDSLKKLVIFVRGVACRYRKPDHVYSLNCLRYFYYNLYAHTEKAWNDSKPYDCDLMDTWTRFFYLMKMPEFEVVWELEVYDTPVNWSTYRKIRVLHALKKFLASEPAIFLCDNYDYKARWEESSPAFKNKFIENANILDQLWRRIEEIVGA